MDQGFILLVQSLAAEPVNISFFPGLWKSYSTFLCLVFSPKNNLNASHDKNSKRWLWRLVSVPFFGKLMNEIDL